MIDIEYTAIVSVIYLLIIFLLKFFDRKKIKLKFNFNKKDTIMTLTFLIFGILLLFTSFKLGFLKYNIGSYGLFLFFAIVYAPLIVPVEEALFRGVIQSYFIDKVGLILGVMISSAVFGAAHLLNGAEEFSLFLLNYKLFFVAFIGGALFGFLFAKTKSIIYPIILHIVLGGAYIVLFN